MNPKTDQGAYFFSLQLPSKEPREQVFCLILVLYILDEARGLAPGKGVRAAWNELK